ncbi:MAG: hypothetical protein ABIR39_03530, partial [Nocardioides sp.]
HDHIVAFNHDDPTSGGASCDCNIAPLCRHHHQLKTHAGWRYTPLETGTIDVTPTRPTPGSGCRHQVRRQ